MCSMGGVRQCSGQAATVQSSDRKVGAVGSFGGDEMVDDMRLQRVCKAVIGTETSVGTWGPEWRLALPLVQTKPHAAYFHCSAALAQTRSLRRTHAMLLLPPYPLPLLSLCVAPSPPVWIITRPLPLSDPISVAHLKKGHTHLSVYMHARTHTPWPVQKKKKKVPPPSYFVNTASFASWRLAQKPTHATKQMPIRER